MTGLYRREGSPYWYFDLTVGGKRKRCSTRRIKKSEAEIVRAAHVKKALDAEQLGERPMLTLREALFDKYLPRKKGLASYPALETYCKTLCGDREGAAKLGWGGDMKFQQITSTMLGDYRVARLAEGLSEQSVNHEIKVVSGAYHLIEEDYLVRPGVKFPITKFKLRAYPLTDEEIDKLLADLDPERPLSVRGGGVEDPDPQNRPLALRYAQRVDNYDLVIMLLDTGARFGEIAGLTWTRVDKAEFKTIELVRTKVGNRSVLTMTDRASAILRRRYEARKNSRFVFPGNGEGDRDEPRHWTAAIRRAMDRVGINDPEKIAEYGRRRDVRAFRDTFASKLRRAGVALDRIQPLLGHSDMQMTMKYADLAVEQASTEAVAILNQLNQ